MSIFSKALRIGEGKRLKELEALVGRVNALEPETEVLSDADLAAKTVEFRSRMASGESIDDLEDEAFAVVREAAKRTLGERPFDVQVIGAGALHRGMIAEQVTGEAIVTPALDVYGIGSLTEFLARLYGSSPDLVVTVEDETLVRGVYSATWTMVGTFNGLVPYEAKGMSIIKFRRWSREVYYWRDYYTEGDIMSNIPGFDEAILGFRTYYRCAVDPTFDCPLELGEGNASPQIEPLANSPASDKYARRIRSLISLRWKRLEVGRALVEINASNWQSLLPYYTEDYEYHDPIVDIYGFDTLVPFFARLFASSPDLVTTVEDEMLIGGVYTATWTMVGQFDGVPYEAKGMSILKFRDWSTQTYYSRDYYSESDIMATIPGLDQAVEGFRISYRCVVDPAFDCPLPPLATLEADGQ